MLKFSPANSKLQKLAKRRFARKYLKGRKLYSLDLVAGKTCPFARDCKSHVQHTADGPRIVDGPHTVFRCYAASQEVIYSSVLKLHEHNTDLIRKCRTAKEIARLILSSLPKNAGIIRYHASGDFFNREYFKAAILVARLRPDILFYGYTKAIGYLTTYKLPENFTLVASYGGTLDTLIEPYQLKSVKVVKSTYEARKLGLPVDQDDSHAANPASNSFALVVHGPQPKGSELAKIITRNNRRKALTNSRETV